MKTRYSQAPDGRVLQTHNGRVLHEAANASELTFAYNDETGILMWHGPTANVVKSASAFHRLYPKTRLALAVFPEGTPVETLNRAVSHSGGIVPELRRRIQHAKTHPEVEAPKITYLPEPSDTKSNEGP